jgi:hypothetical protein
LLGTESNQFKPAYPIQARLFYTTAKTTYRDHSQSVRHGKQSSTKHDRKGKRLLDRWESQVNIH